MTKRSHYKPGDVEIEKLNLIRYDENWAIVGKPLNLLPQLAELNIYEDITKPTLYAEIILNDSIDIIKHYPIVSEETIEIQYITPAEGYSEPIRLYLSVIGVENIIEQPDKSFKVYTIRAISFQHVKNTQKMVMQSFDDHPHKIVKVILKDYLDAENKAPEPKKLIAEETKDTINVVIPKMRPFVAIDFIRKRAISKENVKSPLLFFENCKGFNFCTIDSLLKIGKAFSNRPYYRVPASTNVTEQSKDYSFDKQEFRTIEVFENVSHQNSYRKLAGGALKNVVKSFDITSKVFTIRENILKDNVPELSDEKGTVSVSNMFISKFKDSGKELVTTTTVDIGSNLIDTLGAKEIIEAFVGENILRMLVPGDSDMVVGRVIEVQLPDGAFGIDARAESSFTSGNYLVTRLRHIMAGDEHKMAMECVKVGVK